ncbi:hypothetical protein IAT38_000398 [Cryptococcus sp. DSM 104549]
MSEVTYEQVLSQCRPNWLKDKMATGALGLGFGITVAHALEVVQVAKISGYDAIFMNMEHQRTGIETAIDIMLTCLNLGISPIVVVPSNQSDWISRLLDNGAQGIIVPRTNTAAMAREMVRCSKHRPLGERPIAFTPQQNFVVPHFRHTQSAANATTLTCPMIETVEGLDNVEEIAAVEGVDMLFVGCWDLSDDMGISGEYDQPQMEEALDRICKAATAASIYVGFGGLEPRPDILARLRKAHKCVGFVFAGRDLSMLQSGMASQVEKMKDY